MNRPTSTRREFLETIGYTTAGLVAAGYSATAQGFQANETINVGCIGTGGRCRRLRLRSNFVFNPASQRREAPSKAPSRRVRGDS
jgi:hypothetical protein